MQLNAENVTKVLKSCLFDEGYTDEDLKRAIEVESVMLHIGFDSDRVKQHEKEIVELLEQLPKEFKKTEGGGWSFLNACMDKDGNHWGEHRNIDELIALGLAVDKIQFLLPREVWVALPGAVPYFVYIND